MVDAQIHPIPKGRGVFAQKLPGGHIGGHHGPGHKALRSQQIAAQKAQPGRQVLIGQKERLLSQSPQQTAQSAAGADGIPIGAAVGEDEEVIVLPEKIGGFIQRQRRHGVPPEARAADGAAG